MATAQTTAPATNTTNAPVQLPRDPATGRTYLNRKAVENIMSKRGKLDASLEGRKVRFTVTTNGNPFIVVRKNTGEVVESIVEPGTPFEKMIYNLDANSSLAMANKLNWAIAADATKLEAAGDFAGAHAKYNEFLNKMQVSFSIPVTNPIWRQIGRNVDIEGRVQKITTANGSLLTLDPTSIRVIQAAELAKTGFSFDDFLGADDSKDEDATKSGAGSEASKLTA